MVIVATESDGRNLLLAQQLRTRFDVGRLVVVVNDPRNRSAFDLSRVHVVCVATVLGAAVGTQLFETDDGSDEREDAD